MAGPTKVDSLRRLGPLVLIGGLGLGALALQSTTRALGAAPDDERAAALLADMLRSVRQVVAQNQPLINNPDLGDKGLTGDVVLRQTLGAFREKPGTDPDALEPEPRDARLVSALEASIREVVDEQQHLIN